LAWGAAASRSGSANRSSRASTRRSRAEIITKFGNIDLPEGKKATNGKPEYIYQCCDASLGRLGVDVIDF